MDKNKIISNLTYGVFVSFIVGFVFSISIGVKDKMIANCFISGATCFIVSTLDCILILRQITKDLERKIYLRDISTITPLILRSYLFGFVFPYLLKSIFKVDICGISRFLAALFETLVAVVLGNYKSYIAILKIRR